METIQILFVEVNKMTRQSYGKKGMTAFLSPQPPSENFSTRLIMR